jgi:hypothetical protein
MVLTGYAHGTRASEIVGLRVSDLYFDRNQIHINRLKGSETNVQEMVPGEREALLATKWRGRGQHEGASPRRSQPCQQVMSDGWSARIWITISYQSQYL